MSAVGWQHGVVLIAVAATLCGGVVGAQEAGEGEPRAVDELDLERYAGLWYEIARIPNRFQRKCSGDVAAHYTLVEDDRVEVVNSCTREDGKRLAASAMARLADDDGPASRLEVRFAPAFLSWLPWVWADYWVLEVDPEYAHAVVGTPNHKYLWILARTPTVDEATYQRLVGVAAEQGFDTGSLVRTPQTPRDIPSEAYGRPGGSTPS